MYLEAVVSEERAALLQRRHFIIVRDGSKLVTFSSNNNRYSGTFLHAFFLIMLISTKSVEQMYFVLSLWLEINEGQVLIFSN